MNIEPLEDDPAVTADERAFIVLAYEIARSAVRNGNHPFGALLARQGEVLAKYENAVLTTKDVTRHAETGLVSLVSAELDVSVLSGATLYTSTEPCIMCCGAIHWSGIERVVYGVTSSQMAVVIGEPYRGIPCREVFERLHSAVDVKGPVAEAEGLETHRDFWPDFLNGTAPP